MSSKDIKLKTNSQRTFSLVLLTAFLLQALVIVLYLAFVFFSDSGIFKSGQVRIERKLSLYVNSIFQSVDVYSERMKNITETYSFQDFIYDSLLDGIDNGDLEKISSMFRNTHLPFTSVTLYLLDGQVLMSIPTTIDRDVQSNNFRSIQYTTPRYVRAIYKESYGGVEFATAITNNQGTTIGFLSATVDKDIFKTSVPNSSVILLDNGVVYFDDTMDLKGVPRTSLVSLLNKTVVDEINSFKLDNNNYMFYSIGIRKVSGLNVGIIVYTDTLFQKYSKYIILSVFSIFFIFLVVAFIYDHIKRKKSLSEIDRDKLFTTLDDEEQIEDGDDNTLYREYEKEANKELYENYEKDNEYIEKESDEEVIPVIESLDNEIKDIFLDNTKYTYKRNRVYAKSQYVNLSDEEDDYFSSKDSFDISKKMDFLIDDKKSEKDIFDDDVEKSVDDILKMASKYSKDDSYSDDNTYELNDVPTIPDEYFSKSFKSILDVSKGVVFIERDMDYITKWIKSKSGIDVHSSMYLEKNDDNIYRVVSSNGVDGNTEKLFNIEEKEAIYTKFLISRKVTYISNPKLSKSLTKKFDRVTLDNIDAIIFIPVENEHKELKAFYVALSKKGGI